MSDLTPVEIRKLEKLFQMSRGYVLDFSNRTFAEFVAESTGRDIDDSKYDYASGSKANRLRAFWKQEPNYIVAKLLHDLLEYCRPVSGDSKQERLFAECMLIVQRLRESAPVEALDAIKAEGGDRDFEVLAREVHDSIRRNAPEAGLDRLHTYVTKLVRKFAEKRGVAVDRDKPLHSVFSEYVKSLRKAGLIESEMTERILKSSISIIEAFNKVRNERSLAHDNPTLNSAESLLIFSHICSLVRFIREIEASVSRADEFLSGQEAINDEILF
ncbi:MAG: abortive infection family protein [Chloroflexus sp.]|uniref:abortive infection family protein n=1 Tax=Chloroflexus sp. TaxID=1904827 RepID=UPI00309F10E5